MEGLFRFSYFTKCDILIQRNAEYILFKQSTETYF